MEFEALADRPTARYFGLKGRGLEVKYYTLGDVGYLAVKDDKGGRTFSGSEIRVEQSQLGRLLSVYLSVIIDGDTKSLTLILPAVNLPASGSASIGAVAIFTTHRSTFAGPGILDGALEVYKTVSLKGKALAGIPRDT